jgi:hypothetical protein
MGEHSDINYLRSGSSATDAMLGLMAGKDNGANNPIWMVALLAILSGRRGLFGGDEGAGVAAAVASTNAAVERNAAETLNAITTNTILAAIGASKDTTQNLSTALAASISGVKDSVQSGFTGVTAGLGAIGREICESNCATQRVVEAGTARVTGEIFATNTNLGNQITNAYNNLAMIATQNYNGLTLQNQNLSSKVDAGFCDVKTAIREDGNATRALINESITQDLRDKLAEERESHRATRMQINVGSTVSTGIGNTSGAINDSIVNSFNAITRRQDEFESRVTNVLVNLNSSIQRMESSLASTSAASNVNIQAANNATLRSLLDEIKDLKSASKA